MGVKSSKKNNIKKRKKKNTDVKKGKVFKTVNTNEVFIDNSDKIVDDLKEKGINKGIILASVLICLYMLVLSLFVFFPKINLVGDTDIVLSYDDSYEELGYESKIYDKILIDSNVKDGVVGDYEVKYYYDFLGVRVNRKRNISIVDNESPKLEIEQKVLNICPNQDVPDVKYSAIDGYDGDITSNVEKEVLSEEIFLKVKDSSGNYSIDSIKIIREDKEKPVIKLKGSSYMYLNYGQRYYEPGYEVSDNCGNNLSDRVKITGNVGVNLGTYNITYEVVDDSGNKNSVTRKVVVGNSIVDKGIVHTGSIYLTFDDGPNEGTTNMILDVLKEEGVKATFFVTCNGPDYLIKRMYDEGHTVALHTATHNYSYVYSSVDNYYRDLYQVRDRVKRITGIDSKIIRFPGGSSNTVSRNFKVGIMTELSNLLLHDGYRYYDWNVDSNDAGSARSSSDVYYNVTSNLYINRENMVLMHDIKSITAYALRDIIRFGKNSGYTFNKIDMDTYMVRHGLNN